MDNIESIDNLKNLEEDDKISQPVKDNQQKTITSNHRNSQQFRVLLSYKDYFGTQLYRKFSSKKYNLFSVIDPSDEDRKKYSSILLKMFSERDPKDLNTLDPELLELDIRLNRGIAVFLGLAICDAFGASTQFIHFQKDRRDLVKYDFINVRDQVYQRVINARGPIGIWTDDCSMALCIADSLMLNNYRLEPIHLRYMFHMWLQHGLNNGGRDHSIGLGGNIAISMRQFCKVQKQYTEQGDGLNNGNGSLMRLAPIPLCFLQDQKQAMLSAERQSRTTHNGGQAKQCSKLLTLIIIRLIKRQEKDKWRQTIDQACQFFVNNVKTIPSVECLAFSRMQSKEMFEQNKNKYQGKFTRFNKKPQDRNWNWKNPDFTYSKCRTKDQPGYIGSYCMDALSMALHTVWNSNSFQEVALINTNMGGDCDTVGAIAGQLAGAIYGIDNYMLHLYSQMPDSKNNRFQIFLKALKLIKHSKF